MVVSRQVGVDGVEEVEGVEGVKGVEGVEGVEEVAGDSQIPLPVFRPVAQSSQVVVVELESSVTAEL